MKFLLGRLWAWSFVLTIPVSAAFGYWLWGTWQDFATFGIRFDTSPMKYDLRDTGLDRYRHALRMLRLSVASGGAGWPEGVTPLRTISLVVPESEMAKLEAQLPHSGFEYVKGQLWNGRDTQRVSVRYRGDYVQHWGYPKKSLRVRTRKSEPFEGMRQFNLIAPKYPEQLNNYLGYRLAAELGLIAPRAELVELVLNGRRGGLHLLVEQLDETTLSRQRRTPGDLYSGELVARDAWRGIVNAVWDHPGLWEKTEINRPAPAGEPLVELARLANAFPAEDSLARLSALLDLDAWGRFAAFETLTQCLHYDESHNWRLFWDGSRGMFEPAVWDPVAWAPAMRVFAATQLDIVSTRLHALLMMNGDFLRARHRALAKFFDSGGAEAFLTEVDDAIVSARVALARDPDVRPLDLAAVEEQTARFRASIERVFTDVKKAFLPPAADVQYAQGSGTVALRIDGRRPVDDIELVLREPPGQPLAAQLRYWRGGVEHTVEITGAVVQGQSVKLTLGLMAEPPAMYRAPTQLLRNTDQPVAPAYYELSIGGPSATAEVQEVRVGRDAAKRVDRLDRSSLHHLYRVLGTGR